MPAPLIFLLLTCGLLLSETLGNDPAKQTAFAERLVPLEAPLFSIASGRGRLVLEGMTVSAAHESTLVQLATEHFGELQTQTSFRPGVILSDEWASASRHLLYAVAALDSAQAVMQGDSINIRGVTVDANTFSARLDALRENLLEDTTLETDVIVVASNVSVDELCEQSFSGLTLEPISFRQSSTDIRTASYATLDRVIDFAHDCRRATIAIIGHTDATGSESWNQHLSRARAQAVANHLADNGIDPTRLVVEGRGSLQPIADNTTPHGRGLNRRIDFKLR